ncbi:AAA family ATPase [Mesorhizobium sp. L-8-3]|uniref:AAA family ATPase n=1 Tax=Mesorhizobium sp. L-8-3 TaxID=2744522 RepID=UPI0019278AAA|nr:AAA family ATPase [Mesorhizobium sp. L-8-3]BCH26856.1 hypothetical protein MesoLjLb_66410 [Mesorhizobium sp. L-8-3]
MKTVIKVDRDSVPFPEVLRRGRGGAADEEFQKASAFYSEFDKKRQHSRFEFKLYRHKTVRDALAKLFNGKCAYCESQIAAIGYGDVDNFRPKGGVLDAGSTYLPLHYWWLTNEWTNLYLSCSMCSRAKGGRFPLEDEKDRAPVLASASELLKECPLLLDPCVDDVENILLFSSNGTVSCNDPRGLTTIEILSLNRAELVKARQQTARAVLSQLEVLSLSEGSPDGPQINTEIVNRLKEMMSPEAPYASMCRQLVSQAIAAKPNGMVALAFANDPLAASVKAFTSGEERAAQTALNKFQADQESYSLEAETEQTVAAYVSTRDRLIESVRIKNLRAIANLDLNVIDGSERAPWLMLLGENATGKSTVLHSIALALVGERYRGKLVDALHLDVPRMVRNGADFGEVSIRLTGATEPRTLRIQADGTITATGREAQLMLLAYGSTRLLPRKPNSEVQGTNYARVENLFDPFIPLVDAQQWLLTAPAEAFDYAAGAIKKALTVDVERELVRQDGEVGIIERGALIPLPRLCDGYQTVIALIADILSVVLPAWKTPDLAQGLVLIDEVGNHLHPSWKLRFVESVRSILPGMQVIATTHEPLCLRGLHHGEVAVLQRGPRGGIHMRADLPAIDGMRVDQILMSEHFGLQSTLDPSLQSLFDEYYALLREDHPSPDDRQRMETLRNDINQKQKLGVNERERRMLEAIDRFLARRIEVPDQIELAEREQSLDAELSSIWSEALVRVEGAA